MNMSAIWGIIDLNKNAISSGQFSMMETEYYKYKIDRYESYKSSYCQLGCGIQYVTPEAVSEILPVHDEDNGIYITADLMLDNREEVLKLLSCSDTSIPDGTLIYDLYQKFGISFIHKIYGAYTICIYDSKIQEIYLIVDHMANRSLYYSLVNGTFYFSTLETPIVNVCHNPIESKWITAALTTLSPDLYVYGDLCAHQGIRLCEAGEYLTVRSSGVKKTTYWDPRSIHEEHFDCTADYQTGFVSTFTDCVKSLLRSPEETGCTLSSGLDSSSVASVAASLLQEKQKKLFSYTSIPHSGYVSDLDPFYITDESPGVKLLCKEYPNIYPAFLSCKNRNSYQVLKRLVPLLEIPCMNGQNLVWLDEVYQNAADNKCRIMLKGQYGNSTISYGNIMSAFYQKLNCFQFRAARNLLEQFCTANHLSKKRAYRVFLSMWKERILSSFPHDNKSDILIKVKDNKDIMKHINKISNHGGGSDIDTRKERLNFLFYKNALSQLNTYDTKFGLIYGLIIRDPCKDKRIIELCARLPMECFVAEHKERALVRTYMSDYVPAAIRLDINHRGIQSADLAYRTGLIWSDIKNDIIEKLSIPDLLQYVEKSSLDEIIGQIQSIRTEELNNTFLSTITQLYAVSIYLSTYNHHV